MTAVASPRAAEADDVVWLQQLLGVRNDGEPIRYLARPSAAEPRLLIPTRPRRAAAGAMRRLHGDRNPRAALELAGGRLLGRSGLLVLAPGDVLVLPPFELVHHLARRLGQPSLTAAVTLGPPRRNRKPVLQLLRPDGRVVGFAKVGWSALTRELVTTEAEILQLVAGNLPPSVVVPALIDVERLGDLVVSICTELRPPTGPTVAPDANRVAELVAQIGRGRRRVAELPLVVAGRNGALADAVDLGRLLDVHGRVEVETGLWHGDFTPWNMVHRRGRTYLWDWEFAGRDRPVGFDVLHHHFEGLRRRPGTQPEEAVATLVAGGDAILTHAVVAGGPGARAAVVDVYLLELLAREQQLDGQRWSGGDMALLGPVLVDTIRRRLG